MYKLIFIFLFVSIIESKADKPYNISSRTGIEIDLTERNYFKLFPGIQGFRKAVFSIDGNNAIRVDFSADSDSAIIMNYDEAEELIKYLNSFEKTNCWNSQEITELNFDLFSKYTEAGNHFIDPPYSTIQTFDGRIVNSKIIYADSSWIIAWKDKEYYDPENALKKTEIFHYSQVQAIFIGEWEYLDGTRSSYLDLLPLLWDRDYARVKTFADNIPPELWKPFDDVRSKLIEVEEDISQKELQFKMESSRLYNISISYNIEAVRLKYNELYYYYNEEVPGGGSFCGALTTVAAVQNLNIAISRHIYDRWRGKLEFIYYPDRTSSFDRTLLISGFSISPEIEYVVLRHIPGVPSVTKDLELTFHAGLEFMSIRNNSVIPYLDGNSGWDCNHDAKRLEGNADASLIAYRLGIHLDLFLAENISFFVNSELSVSEAIELKPMETDKGEYEYVSNNYEILPLKFGPGLKWHL